MEKQKSQSHHQQVQLALFLLREYYFLDNDVIVIRDSNDYDMESEFGGNLAGRLFDVVF